jgi:type IX secretion system substrate protein
MNKYFIPLRLGRVIGATVLLLAIFIGFNQEALSVDKPQIPILSLTGDVTGYNDDWYPDGRIWVPAALNGAPREFFLPVFIQNQWYHYQKLDVKKDLYKPTPIKAFKFKLLFDTLAFKVIEIAKFHPFPDKEDIRGQATMVGDFGGYYEPLAKDFTIQWNVAQDSSYRIRLDPQTPASDRGRGQVLTISGTSSKPMMNTNIDKNESLVLLYVKCRVLQDVEDFNRLGARTPIMISDDTIFYNELNIRQKAPFEHLRTYYGFVQDDYPDPGPFTGMGGINYPDADFEIMRPGVIWLRITEAVPFFTYRLERGIGTIPAIETEGQVDELWIMQDPVTVDSGKVYSDVQYGVRQLEIQNGNAGTRMNDVFISADEPWLQFNLESLDKNLITMEGGKNYALRGYIKYLDNGILGSPDNDAENEETQIAENIYVNLRCDPNLITDSPYGEYGGEKAGVYVGYINFVSDNAIVSPVRLRVTFINFRDPFESPLYPDDDLYTTEHAGMWMEIENSKFNGTEKAHMIFGTGYRATDGVDEVFGEFAYKQNPEAGTFHARFYHPDEQFAIDNNLQFGFGDFFPNDEQTQTGLVIEGTENDHEALTGSRDIRSINATTQSIKYLVKFDPGHRNNYPINIRWDVKDFPEDAQLFIADVFNGQKFPSVNMRKATLDEETPNKEIRSYIISDPEITSFIIEYTLPRVIEYVDNNGDPIIKHGWNFLSLPVRAENKKWDEIYVKCKTEPIYFNQNIWQTEDDGVLRVGIGYFVKYDSNVDKQFNGTFISNISADPNNPGGFIDEVRVFPGWNAIGSVSGPISVDDIEFTEYEDFELPRKDYIEEFGVYGFNTIKGYHEVYEMFPGLGYWVKCNSQGYLDLFYDGSIPLPWIDREGHKSFDKYGNSAQIIVRDNAQHEGTVHMFTDDRDMGIYEMPPAPPEGLFDMRFTTGRNADNTNDAIINLQSIEYPIEITVSNSNVAYTFTDAISGKELGTIAPGKDGVIEVPFASNSIRVSTNNAYDISLTCTPNPVNGNSMVKYFVNADDNVTLKVYDLMGNVVNTLVNNEYRTAQANAYEIPFNASGLSAGRYIAKLQVGSQTTVLTITVH